MDTTVAIIILVGSFFTMLLMGIEITYSLGIAALATCLYLGINPMIMFQTVFNKMANYSLLAVPFFILMGEFMTIGGMSTRLVDLAFSLVGWLPGGLGMVNVVASMFFGGISGSSTADVASLGPLELQLMREQKYDDDFAAALTMTSSIQGIIIPPSFNIVVYAVTAGGISIAALYMGGILSGVLLGVCLMVYTFFVAKKRHYPRNTNMSLRQIGKALLRAGWSIGAMVIVVGAVFGGIMTATEAAAAAALYTFVVAYFIHRTAKWSQLVGVFRRTVKIIGSVLILAATATAFSWVVTYLRIPQLVTAGLLAVTQNKIIMLLIINMILLVLGCVMNMWSIILIMTPILLPIVQSFGMHAVQFGIMMILNLGIGLLTPPVGVVLFVGSSVSGLSVERLTKALLPQYLVMLVALLLITFIPGVTMYLPKLFGYIM